MLSIYRKKTWFQERSNPKLNELMGKELIHGKSELVGTYKTQDALDLLKMLRMMHLGYHFYIRGDIG